MELNRFKQLLESTMGNVKPLINEEPTVDKTKKDTFVPQTCADLERYGLSSFLTSEPDKAEKEFLEAIKTKRIKAMSWSRKGFFRPGDNLDDPYNYIVLKNNTFCTHSSRDDTNHDWSEIKGDETKKKVCKNMCKRKSPENSGVNELCKC